MFKIHVDPFLVHGWQGQRIKCGPLSLILAPSIGGRIISLRYEGKELLWVDKDHWGEVFDLSAVQDLAAQKQTMGFRLWGGDKTWVAPQNQWKEGIPPLELDAGGYVLTWEAQEAVMTSPVCRETGLRIVRRIKVDGQCGVHLKEEFHNMTDQVISKGIWNVTQVTRPCEFFIPAKHGSFRSYHQEDRTLPEVKNVFTQAHGWTEIFCREPKLFKCGGIPSQGQILIKMPLGGPYQVVWLKTFELDPAAAYAHGSAVEVFNSDKHEYAEIELHAPFVQIAPGGSCQFAQQWHFKKI